MKNKLLAILMLFICSYAMVSCQKIKGDGPIVKEERQVTEFSRISASLDGTNYVTQEGERKLTIEAQQNILDVIETRVVDGRLSIYFKNGKRIGRHDPIVVRISTPVINDLDLQGSSDMLVTNDINTNELKLNISGSGEMKLKQVQVTQGLYANISGSGNILALGGTAAYGNFSVSGSGSINLLPVIIPKVEAHIGGSGNIRTTATNQLDVHISGSGNLWYGGNPVLSTHISGSGNVRKNQ
ncbi:MAG: DUF2807 domain-containing protein [Chitinophagaceae bacterium]|nr:DUF2807 domain-containing protein [Chitinophagaceae bacterium]